MASRNTHPPGKPAGLSPADLPLLAEPVAYLTSAAIPEERTARETRDLHHSLL